MKSDLEDKAIIDGYSRIPIYTWMAGPNFFDDIETKSCDYVRSNSELRWDNTTYGDKVAFDDIMYLKYEL